MIFSKPNSMLGAAFGLVVCVAISLAVLVYPIYVIRPFRYQGPRELAVALTVLRFRPPVEIVLITVAIALAIFAWRRANRMLGRITAIVCALAVMACAFLSRVNVYELMFHPLTAPSFSPVAKSKLDGREQVIAVRVAGQARAYPIRSMSYHHIVNDTLAGLPIVATYWTLCHTGLVFQRTIDGLELRFHLAGINNQNFLMRDEQTGTYWQQITGLSVAGPLKGRRLTLVPADELTLALWKSEHPEGSVLNDVPKYAGEYSDRDWDKKMAKVPTVVSYAQAGLKPRDLMLGIHAFGLSRAVPYEAVLKEKLIQDHMAGEPIPLVLGPDGQSVRAFRQLVPGASEPPEFYRMTEESHSAQTKGSNAQTLMMDAQTGSEWNFQGCAVAGKLKGSCLAQLQMIKDYWFDWRNYNRQTSVYGINRKIQ